MALNRDTPLYRSENRKTETAPARRIGNSSYKRRNRKTQTRDARSAEISKFRIS